MVVGTISAWFTEENLKYLFEQYAALGPLPGILLTFIKSFIPPIPTIVLITINAAVYGLWFGFLYSFIGLIGGSLTFFLILRKLAGTRYAERLTSKPKVQRGLKWVRRNSFSYVFLLSLFPIGPFVVINIVAAVAKMSLRKFATGIILGKAIMVFTISYLGQDWAMFIRDPMKLLYIGVFLALSIHISRRIEQNYTRE
jgi:uncharacterized membrane protein YdjX (TVP38/TMEM64 family)